MCGKSFKKKSFSGPCPFCGKDWVIADGEPIHRTSKAPAKGSKEWYDGKWFRRSDKDWHEDIQKRVQNPDGSITRR